MKRRIIRKTARSIVNLCDWMMGYHGKLIRDAVQMIVLTTPAVFLFALFAIVMS